MVVKHEIKILIFEHEGVIVEREVQWNVNALRARHAVSATCAANLKHALIAFAHPCDQVKLRLRERISRGALCNPYVLDQLRHRAHPAQCSGNLTVIPHPSERPFGRSPFDRSRIPELLDFFGDSVNQPSPTKRFHDDDAEPSGVSIRKTFFPCLVVFVKVVVLD